MDNLSEYVPLIIIIGSIIYSVVKGGMKKAREETAKTTLPGRTSNETVVRERNIPPKNATKAQKPPKSASVSASVIKKEPRETLFGNRNAKTPERKASMPEEPEDVKPVLDVDDNEEIRKAFIYAEILNRKVY
jgi:hypothetical protein